VIAMRARMSWLFSQLRAPAGVERDLVGSSAGVSWVARMYAETPVSGYWIMSEVEENLPVCDYPRYFTAEGTQPLGPLSGGRGDVRGLRLGLPAPPVAGHGAGSHGLGAPRGPAQSRA
jgi:hypothetical protein